MTRLFCAATAARASRALAGLGAAFVLAMVASGCANSAPPAPTPDPFAGLADRSDQAFRRGLEAYGQGQYREALTSFESARTLSPTDDPRIVQMIDRSRVALAPTATPIPPPPTAVPVVPTATPVAMSSLVPDTELGRRFFGQVSLATVPGQDSDAPAATQFFYQDQIGLHIEGLKQHLRLPFAMRVFNTDTSQLVAEIRSEEGPIVGATQIAQIMADPTSASVAATKIAQVTGDPKYSTATPVGMVSGRAGAPTPAVADGPLTRFWTSYVWYHKGGEEPGRYRLELFANGILTDTFDYTVGSVPVPTLEPTLAPTLEPTPAPTDIPVPDLVAPAALPAVQAPSRSSQSSTVGSTRPAAPAALPTAEPTALPTATTVPTPQNAYTTVVGGVPAGLDVDMNRGRFYIADSSGVIWASDAPMGVNDAPLAPSGQERPTLGTPIHIGASNPVDLAVDPTSGFLYVSARSCASGAAGCVLVVDPGKRADASDAVVRWSIALPATPGDLRLDPEFGLVYIALPELRAIAEVNIRAGTLVRVIENLPQITSLALDPLRHTLYAAHLAGQLTVIDVPSGQVTARVSLTTGGLASVATARGLAYAVNTVTHELAVVEPMSQVVNRYPLDMEPAAVTASEDSGAVFVLSSRFSDMLRIDPTSGLEVGRVRLIDPLQSNSARSGHSAASTSSLQSFRPRVVLNAANETVYATLPETGRLAAVTVGSFPILAREIPRIETPAEPLFASIPGLLQPAAQALPSESNPALSAQAPPAENSAPTGEEGLQ